MSMSLRDRAALADRVEARAYVDLYDAAPPAVRSTLGIQVRRIADATLLIASRLPSPMFNRVIGLGLERTAAIADVDAIAAAYQGATSASWWLHWSPFARPSDFSSRLIERGFAPATRPAWAKMLYPSMTAPRIATDLQIGPANDEDVDTIASAIATAFGMPPVLVDWIRALRGRLPWRLYAVADRAQIVGGGALFVRGDCAWLGMGAVLPSHRRRGGHGALMARRIADALDAGARCIVTETGEAIGEEPNPSLANMKRCGFERVASRLNFAAPSTA